jgi:aspartyl-tRNA(Asn)/glutamyl-tRNA(Gln) amidotransferase subunit C
MQLTHEDVLKNAHLAKITIDNGSIPKFVKELSNIMDLVAQMDAVDTSTIAPMAHPLAASQRLRGDAVTEHDQRELFQSIAPLVQAGLYLVPKVIE